ncbi:Protein of unknown function [Pseudomonas flavescens]|uniref:DUF998 domain-containing protein n=1 Tax=Phytopseudomonas flavescens TaxID=29435 RepID=A0A1G8KTB6_9GAMM|nr:DUF998 domain-containing protein [Pseudomonas flavescens]SDI46668.1 Protein of unknown function [Pseudomonas flavescens]
MQSHRTHRTLTLGYLAGLITPLWLALGVALAGALYPGYSHFDQAMSLLGAEGAPTQFISPLINNFPLGALFMLFGVAVLLSFDNHWARFSGLLIILHGLGSFGTGYFACDAGCAPQSPSTSQNLHNLAGLVMALSLLLASAIWVYLGLRLLGSRRFSWFSLLCTLLALGTLPLMAEAVQSGQGFGLYQRINYGSSLLWLATLALMLMRRAR